MRKSLTTGLSALLLAASLTLPVPAAELPTSTPQLIEHLGFLGYQCTRELADPENAYIQAVHDKQWNFILLKSDNGLSLIVSFKLKSERIKYRSGSLRKRFELLELLNTINSTRVLLPQVYLYTNKDGKTDLQIQAWMPDVYDKTAFSAFMERWQEDSNVAIQMLRDYLALE